MQCRKFRVAIGKDDILLNELIGLKEICFKQEIYKIWFPIESIEKYTELIYQKGYSYIVYYFNKEKAELEVLLDYVGENKNIFIVIFDIKLSNKSIIKIKG